MCMDDDTMTLNLNMDSEKLKNFQLVFFACDPESIEGRCADENEIKEFFTHH